MQTTLKKLLLNFIRNTLIKSINSLQLFLSIFKLIYLEIFFYLFLHFKYSQFQNLIYKFIKTYMAYKKHNF